MNVCEEKLMYVKKNKKPGKNPEKNPTFGDALK